VAWKIIQLNKSWGFLPENVNNNNSVFQIFLMSSKHRQPKLEKFSSNNTTTTTTTTTMNT